MQAEKIESPSTTASYYAWGVEQIAGDIKESVSRVSEVAFDASENANIPTVSYEVCLLRLQHLRCTTLERLISQAASTLTAWLGGEGSTHIALLLWRAGKFGGSPMRPWNMLSCSCRTVRSCSSVRTGLKCRKCSSTRCVAFAALSLLQTLSTNLGTIRLICTVCRSESHIMILTCTGKVLFASVTCWVQKT